MRDLIVGRVTSIIDVKRIKIQVTQIVRKRHRDYDNAEEIRVKELKTNMLGNLKKVLPESFIEPGILGRGVMCLVEDRDRPGPIEADVYVLDRSRHELRGQV